MSSNKTNEMLRKLEERIAKLERGARGPQRFAKGGSGGGAQVVTVKVRTVHDGWLECVRWNPITDEDGAALKVAMPWTFYSGRFDGETITYPNEDEVVYAVDAEDPEFKRAATKGGTEYEQQIISNYHDDAILTVVRVNTGVPTDVVDEYCQWQDLNVDARAWTEM